LEDDVATGDLPARAVGFLIDERPVLAEFAARRLEQEVSALFFDADLLRAAEGEADGVGVCAGRDVEVVFEPPLVAVVDEFDARIDLLITHAREVRDVRPPLRRVGADEVVAPARQLAFRPDARRLVRPHERHPQHGRLRLEA
jgi:hypothetical protein